MRIRDVSLAERVDAAEQSWSRVTRPVLTSLGTSVEGLDLSGKRVVCFGHIRMDSPLVLLPLVRAGASVRIAAVNPDSTTTLRPRCSPGEARRYSAGPA